MRIVTSIRAERIKLYHTPYWGIHILTPVLGAILFVFYFLYYKNVDKYQKLNLILELTEMVFPILISAIVGLNISQEEKASQFQNILIVPKRKNAILAKLFILYFSGLISLVILYTLFVIGVNMNQSKAIPVVLLLQTVLGLAFCNFIIYAFHIFLCLKFGLGISLFFGVFECLQCILYSNIELHGLWRYIPFAWSMNWIQDVFYNRLADHILQWLGVLVLTAIILILIIYWFTRWEGRKNHE